jgi:hypothetical protein
LRAGAALSAGNGCEAASPAEQSIAKLIITVRRRPVLTVRECINLQGLYFTGMACDCWPI